MAIAGMSMLTTGCENGEKTKNKIRIAHFEADATPETGVPLAYNPTKRIDMPLSARGVVLLGNDDPIVLCAVDWIGIGNKARDAWQEALAEVAGTKPERVTVHALHQHDAPMSDFNGYDILTEYGMDPAGTRFDNRDFVEQTIEGTANALREAIENDLRTVTHVGTGTGIVERVASNRRLLNREGKLYMGRMSSTTNVEEQRAPVGTIDPEVKLLSFWNDDEAIAVLSYYACHPQSFYRTGAVNPDFPGIARAAREEATGVRHIHFNGAGGNIAAGKWNDGWTGKRQLLADRLASGMGEAWEQTERTPVHAGQLGWRIEPVALPPGEHLDKDSLEQTLAEGATGEGIPTGAARQLGWLRRCLKGDKIDLTALRIGDARVLHTPAELAVEYQLYARSLYPDDFIANASYGDYDPGYISTEIQYHQGGYEASDRASRVAPEVEHVLLPAIREVLAFDAFQPDAAKLDTFGYRLERSAVNYGYDGEYSWVNGRAGVIPAGVSVNPINKPAVVLPAHQVKHAGPDVFQGLHTFRSRDLGLSWEGPFEDSVFRRESMEQDPDRDRLVTGFIPKFHPATETLLGIGQTAIYEENQVVDDSIPGTLAYATFNVQKQAWSPWKTLEMPGENQFAYKVISSGQRVDLEDGSILLPVYLKDPGAAQIYLSVIRFNFDGETLGYIEHGNLIKVDAGNNFRAPSLARYNDYFYLTGSNNESMYVTSSEDGLQFDDPQPWQFDNGRRLDSGSFRQQWVSHSEGLYLAYTGHQKEKLFLARVDPGNLLLIGESEQAIISGQRGGNLDHVDVTRVNQEESWVIATEWIQPSEVGAEYAANNIIHIARLNWVKSNMISMHHRNRKNNK